MDENMLIDEVTDEKEIYKDAIMAMSEALINISDKINIMNGDIKNLYEMHEKLKSKLIKLETRKDFINNHNNNITTIYDTTEINNKTEVVDIEKKKDAKHDAKMEATQVANNIVMDDIKAKLLKMRRKRR